MKRYLLFKLVILTSFPIIAQKVGDTVNFGVGISSYAYSYNAKFTDGGVAYGPSLFIGKKVGFQLSLLAEARRYYITPYYGLGYGAANQGSVPPPERNTNLFFDFTFHYEFFTTRKMKLFATTGLVLGGNYYLGEHGNTLQQSTTNIIFGAGLACKVFSWLNVRLAPSVRYNVDGILFPGLMVDAIIPVHLDVSEPKR